MSRRLLACALLLALLALPVAHAQEKKPPELDPRLAKALTDLARQIRPVRAQDVNELSLEVHALQRLHQLNLSDAQLEAFGKLVSQVTETPRERVPGTATENFRRTLVDLRDALAVQDDESVNDLNERIGGLYETEPPELDDGIEIVESARKLAPNAVKMLKPGQIAAHLSTYGDSLPSPLEDLVQALGEARKLTPAAWRAQRDALCDPIADALAGLNEEQAHKLGERIMALLLEARRLTDSEFKAKKLDFEKAARLIVGDVGPVDVLKHQIERDLAELLSNPRTNHAISVLLRRKPAT
jgi:hypothetical protein